VTNLAQSPDVVEGSTGDLVDVVLHGQLTVQVDTEVPYDNVTLDCRSLRAVVMLDRRSRPSVTWCFMDTDLN